MDQYSSSTIFYLLTVTIALSVTSGHSASYPGRAYVPQNYPSYTNYPFGRERPSIDLIRRWFDQLISETGQQGSCHVDLQTAVRALPGTYLTESIRYNLDWDEGQGQVLKITKTLTDSEGRTPVAKGLQTIPSSTTCTYGVRNGTRDCYCQYPGKQPGSGYAFAPNLKSFMRSGILSTKGDSLDEY